jgi:hypothetical protein
MGLPVSLPGAVRNGRLLNSIYLTFNSTTPAQKSPGV